MTLTRIQLWWDVPNEAIDALVAEFEEVAQRHGASMPDLWRDVSQYDGTLVRFSISGNLCSHCGAIVGQALQCPGCGWIDPLTRSPEVPHNDGSPS